MKASDGRFFCTEAGYGRFMSFSEILDQAVPVRLLQNIIQRNRTPNGLLFWGPGGVGKQRTAMEFAKALNCTEHEADACGACLACRKVAKGNHPDVKIITPAGKGRIINVETIEFINELAAYQPFEGRWRVILLQDAERMNLAAQNHFLKTLEEPPSNTVFILLTEFPRILLPTIRSRCQQVRFGALRPETVTSLLLQQHSLEPDLASGSGCSIAGPDVTAPWIWWRREKREVVLGFAHRLAQGEDPLGLSEEFIQHLRAQEAAIKATVKAELEVADAKESSKEDRDEQKQEQMALIEALIRRDLMEYLYLFKTWYRDALIFSGTGVSASVFNRDQMTHLEAEAPGGLERKLDAIEKAWRYVERNLSIERVFRDLFFVLAG